MVAPSARGCPLWQLTQYCIHHRLDFTRIAEAADGAAPGFDSSRAAGVKAAACLAARRAVLRLMAADALDGFPGHGGHPGAHELHGFAFRVERLQRDRSVRRHQELGRAVRVHRNRSQHALDVPGPVRTDHSQQAAHPLIGKVVGENAQRLHRPSRHSLQAVAGVDVLNDHHGVLAPRIDLVGNHRRRLGWAQGNGLEQRVLGHLEQRHEVVEYVHQVDPPGRVRRGLAGDQEEAAVQGIGVEELRPARQGQPVFDHPFDLAAETRESAAPPARLRAGPAPGSNSTSSPWRGLSWCPPMTAMTRRGIPGYWPRVEEGVRPIRVAAQELHLPGAVRVHVKEQPRVRVRRIRILPSRVEHTAIVQNGGAPVVFLVEAKLPDIPAVGVHPVEVGHVRTAVHARHANETGGGREQDAAVREVAGIVGIHIRLLAGKLAHLRRRASRKLHLKHLPSAIGAHRGEEHLARVPMQVHITHKHVLARLEHRFQRRLRPACNPAGKGRRRSRARAGRNCSANCRAIPGPGPVCRA